MSIKYVMHYQTPSCVALVFDEKHKDVSNYLLALGFLSKKEYTGIDKTNLSVVICRENREIPDLEFLGVTLIKDARPDQSLVKSYFLCVAAEESRKYYDTSSSF